MSAGHLQDRQEKELFDTINEADGLDLRDFKMLGPNNSKAPRDQYIPGSVRPPTQRLVYEPTGHECKFELRENQNPYKDQPHTHAVEFSPGLDLPTEKHSGLDWLEVTHHFDTWLEILREEYHTENPWEQLRNFRDEIESWDLDRPGSEPFTTDERAYLRAGITKFKEQVQERFDLHDEQLAGLRQDVADLEDQLDVLMRRQWRMSLLGFLLRVGAQVGFSAIDFSWAQDYFNYLLQDLPQLPEG